ncbi:hypothetical protein B0H16DRAFT_1587174 [Mycena metata]|uniref:Uncharacterized protein n=1 Tax=Mycena metata TaxID=1033252 RepID=A0AAD7MRE6_9AGAR|nr:hypothetical protein B0H16DRAFT_1587174 [Mycena metata]
MRTTLLRARTMSLRARTRTRPPRAELALVPDTHPHLHLHPHPHVPKTPPPFSSRALFFALARPPPLARWLHEPTRAPILVLHAPVDVGLVLIGPFPSSRREVSFHPRDHPHHCRCIILGFRGARFRWWRARPCDTTGARRRGSFCPRMDVSTPTRTCTRRTRRAPATARIPRPRLKRRRPLAGLAPLLGTDARCTATWLSRMSHLAVWERGGGGGRGGGGDGGFPFSRGVCGAGRSERLDIRSPCPVLFSPPLPSRATREEVV